MVDDQEIELFKNRLAETIAWCAAQAHATDPANSLRTAALTPSNKIIDATGYEEFDWATEEGRNQALLTLAEQRARLLKIAGLAPAPLPTALVGGRLVMCQPNETLCDGFSVEESMGFFDQNDLPPWDTWIWLFKGPPGMGPDSQPYENFYLICWVPAMFVSLAQKGIVVNSTACILWALYPEASHPFLEQVQAAGLLK